MSTKIEIDKNYLIQKYNIEKLSSYKIAKLLNIGQHIVIKRIKECGIKIRNFSEARRINFPKVIFKCKECGKEISRNKIRCKHCAHLQRNRTIPRKEYFCVTCGIKVSRKSAKRCKKCSIKYVINKVAQIRVYKNTCIDCGKRLKMHYTKRCHPCDVKHRRENLIPKIKCVDCGKTLRHRNSKRCHKCANTGKNNNFYKHGKCNLGYASGFTTVLKNKIRKRDNYICQICGKTQEAEIKELKSKLAVHHINYNKSNHNKDNLISVCRSCHGKTNLNREAWKSYFATIMDKK